MTFGSLFAGIGGIDLGFERAGMQCKWQVEIDEYCRRVLAKHWPDVERFVDVRDCGKHNLVSVDVICGGFPCQDVSLAGKGAGINGERSGLWSEFARIIRELRPRIVVVENVPGLLGRGMGRVLGDLAESGYDAEWQSLPAAAFGAPHIRDRVFIVAFDVANSEKWRCRFWTSKNEQQGSREGDASSNSSSILADSERTGRQARTNTRIARRPSSFPDTMQPRLSLFKRADGEMPAFGDFALQWETEPDVGRVANGVPARVDRLRSLGNAVVPAVAQWIGRRIMEVFSPPPAGAAVERRGPITNQGGPIAALERRSRK